MKTGNDSIILFKKSIEDNIVIHSFNHGKYCLELNEQKDLVYLRIFTLGTETIYPCDNDDCPGKVENCTLSTTENEEDCPYTVEEESYDSCSMITSTLLNMKKDIVETLINMVYIHGIPVKSVFSKMLLSKAWKIDGSIYY